MGIDAPKIATTQGQSQPVKEIQRLNRDLSPVLQPITKTRRGKPSLGRGGGKLAQDGDHFDRGRAQKEMVMRDLIHAPLSRRHAQDAAQIRLIRRQIPGQIAHPGRAKAFLAAQQGQASGELFSAIEGNYADAVRLLTTAHSAKFDGKATLFVAERTLQEGMSPERAWSPWIAELDIYRQDCAHVDIISPEYFKEIGPLINTQINN